MSDQALSNERQPLLGPDRNETTSLLAVNGDPPPQSVVTKPDVSVVDVPNEEDEPAACCTPKKAVNLKERTTWAHRGLAVNCFALVLWATLSAVGHGSLLPYHLHLSAFDVLVVDALRAIIVMLALAFGGPPYDSDLDEFGVEQNKKNTATGEVLAQEGSTPMSDAEVKCRQKMKTKKISRNRVFLIGHYLNVLFLLLLASKLWVFRQWANLSGAESNQSSSNMDDQTDAILNCTIMVLALVFTLASIVITSKLSAIDTPNKTALRLKSMWVILKPYFAPKGVSTKFFVFLIWTFVIAGKASSIISPIYLGQAVNKLTQVGHLYMLKDPTLIIGHNSTNSTVTSTSVPEEVINALYRDIYIYCFLLFFPKLTGELEDVLYVKVWQAAFVQAAEVTFRHLHSLSLDWHLRKKMGNAMRSMDRGLTAADVLMSWLVMRIIPVIGAALAAFLVFAIHFNKPEIAAVCFIALALYMWLTYVITVWRTKFNEEMNTHDNDMHEKATDSLINFETVKYFTNEEFETDRYVSSVADYQRLTFTSQWATSCVNLAQSLTIQLCMLFALLLSAHAIIRNEDGFNVGEFVAIQAYVVTIFAPLAYLGIAYSSIIDALVDMQNLSDLLAEKADIVDSPTATPSKLLPVHNLKSKKNTTTTGKKGAPAPAASVSFSNLRFKYPSQGEDQGLHDINFTVAPGTTTAIVGQTGSGKTTLSRLLFRFYEPVSGTITVGGEDIAHMTQKSLRQVIGVVPQDTCMFNDTIEFNIKYGRTDATMEEVEAAAKSAHILDFIERLPEGWKSQVGERGLKLSGGEKQRIAIARCLLKNPPIVLLDEATSALDNKTERDVQSALQSLKGRTTLVIAHRLTTVRNAEQIIVMKMGRIVERGTHDELISRPDSEYLAMWSAQLLQQEETAEEKTGVINKE